jgi:hypothetical protein
MSNRPYKRPGLAQKLVGTLFVIGSARYGEKKMQRLVVNLGIVAFLALIASVSVIAMLIAGFCATYATMLHYGATPLSAFLVTSLLAAVVALSCALGLMSMRRFKRHASPISRVNTVVDAFIDGLMMET